jgi:hypothetical protein
MARSFFSHQNTRIGSIIRHTFRSYGLRSKLPIDSLPVGPRHDQP